MGLLISLVVLAGCKTAGEAWKPVVKKDVCVKCADFAKKVSISCYDSDNGKNYEVFGFTFGELPAPGGPQGFQADHCVEYDEEGNVEVLREGPIAKCSGDRCGVEEFYCREKKTGGFFVAVTNKKCSEGCSQGHCV